MQVATLVITVITLLMTAYTFTQNQRDRRGRLLKEEVDAAYHQLIAAYEENLSMGDGRRVLEVPPEHRSLIVRAVRERRLAWTGFDNYVGLPSSSIDA